MMKRVTFACLVFNGVFNPLPFLWGFVSVDWAIILRRPFITSCYKCKFNVEARGNLGSKLIMWFGETSTLCDNTRAGKEV